VMGEYVHQTGKNSQKYEYSLMLLCFFPAYTVKSKLHFHLAAKRFIKKLSCSLGLLPYRLLK
jgi:hypothetical protein